jgi:pimeloyl-ACP methyl ester carboxylesterase
MNGLKKSNPNLMKLHYKIFGEGEPIIILHGLFGMLDNWRSMARALEEKYQCILVDLRNHGKSPHADEIEYAVMAEDVKETMDHLQLEAVHLWGHSMGGKVAMQMALLYPERIKTLVVIDISPRAYPPHHDDVLAAIGALHPGEITDRSEAEHILRNHLGSDEATIQFLLKNLSRRSGGNFEWKANMPVLIREYDKIMHSISSDKSFNKPVLFVRGELSNSIRDEDWPDIQRLFPEASLVTIQGAGHWVHADKSEALKEAILTFMGTD